MTRKKTRARQSAHAQALDAAWMRGWLAGRDKTAEYHRRRIDQVLAQRDYWAESYRVLVEAVAKGTALTPPTPIIVPVSNEDLQRLRQGR